MSVPAGAIADRTSRPTLPRRFEAIVFDWDGPALADHRADAVHLRRLVEEACAVGLELAIISDKDLKELDGQLAARPAGPGGLMLVVDGGSAVFRVDRDGPRSLHHRAATPEEQAALSRAAELTVERLDSRGVTARVLGGGLDRRKIDLLGEPARDRPPKTREGELTAVGCRLALARIGGLAEAVEIAQRAALEAGLEAARVTIDGRHLDIGVTDKLDAASWLIGELWRHGIAPSQILVAGEAPTPLPGGPPRRDPMRLNDSAPPAAAVLADMKPDRASAGALALSSDRKPLANLLEDQIARRRDGDPPVSDEVPGWTLAIDGTDPLLERVHESLLTLADGRIGTRGSLLIAIPDDEPSVLLSGIYAGHGPETRLLEAPGWNLIAVAEAAALAARRVLDLHTGTLSHELASAGAGVRALALSSLARPGTAVLRARCHGATLQASRGLRPPPDTPHEQGTGDGCSWMRTAGRPGSIVAASHELARHHGAEGVTPDWGLDRLTCYAGDAAGVVDERTAIARVGKARALGFEALLGEHRSAWAARWDDADVRIDGDPDLQLAVRLALFHLMASAADAGEAAVGARGLTGRAYRGHVFWDSDVYVLPFLAATHPAAARAMLEYRVRRLPAALRAARALGRSGARFPWESAASGEDVTPRLARTRTGELAAVRTGELEEHIVADVAWATAHYIDWTGDRVFAGGPGLELLVQAARWWASRIELDPDGRGHIRAVMGPDEYHEHVDDNAYTNVMARWTLQRAADAADGLLEQTERRRWRELADALIDGYDPASGLYEQFAGFHALEPLIVAEVAPQRPVAADLQLGPERTRSAQVVKQPDALMLHYLVPEHVAPGSLAPNLDHYEPRTAHGSTLSPGVHAALLGRARRSDRALELLRLTARIDLDDISQTTAGGLHLAAMGSVWRALAFGFAGLQPRGDALAVDPVPLPGLDALELRVRFRDSRVRLRVTPHRATISAEPPITALVGGHQAIHVSSTASDFDLSATDGG